MNKLHDGVTAVLFMAALAALAALAAPASGCLPHEAESAGATPLVLTSAASGVTVLRGMRLIDGGGHRPIEDAVLVIVGDRVRAVGPAATTPLPPGAMVFELRGKTILPGLVSDHSHLGLVDGTQAGTGHDTRENILRQLAQFEAYGVTTVTSLGMNGPVLDELLPQIHAGAHGGADAFGADRGIGVPAAAPPVDVGPRQLYRPATTEAARAAVRETAARHPTLVKIWVDDFHGSLPAEMSPDIQSAVIEEAHRNNLRVAAHVYYLADAKALIAEGVDVLAHGIRDRPVDAELIETMKAHGTWYVPTLGLDESFYVFAERHAWMDAPFFRHALQPALAAQLDDPAWRAKILDDKATLATNKQALAVNMQNLKTLHDAGVKIGFGTDSGATPLRIPGFAEHHELRLMTEAGLTPLQAISAATHDAAALLGREDRGLLVPGKLADFVVVDGNPATDIADVDRVVAVWRGGKRRAGGVETFAP